MEPSILLRFPSLTVPSMESSMPYSHIRQLQACARECARAIDKTGHLQECPRDHRHQALPDDQRERDTLRDMLYSINRIIQTNIHTPVCAESRDAESAPLPFQPEPPCNLRALLVSESVSVCPGSPRFDTHLLLTYRSPSQGSVYRKPAVRRTESRRARCTSAQCTSARCVCFVSKTWGVSEHNPQITVSRLSALTRGVF